MAPLRAPLLVATAAAAAAAAATPPNFVFILADDLDWDFKQDRLAIMPNLAKRIAGAGAHFVNHVAAQPVCGPSRTSMLCVTPPPRRLWERTGPTDRATPPRAVTACAHAATPRPPSTPSPHAATLRPPFDAHESCSQGRYPHNVGYKANLDQPSVKAYAKVANNTIGTWFTAAGYHTA